MRNVVLVLAMMAAPAITLAETADGIWKTQTNDAGGYLEVTIGPCETDAAKTCGKISSACNAQGLDNSYEYLGKLMVWDMNSKDGTNYSGGKIWDPESNKTYNSKMTITAAGLDVEGCVAFLCSGQDWTRVK